MMWGWVDACLGVSLPPMVLHTAGAHACPPVRAIRPWHILSHRVEMRGQRRHRGLSLPPLPPLDQELREDKGFVCLDSVSCQPGTRGMSEQMRASVNSPNDVTVRLSSSERGAGNFTVTSQVQVWEWGLHVSALQRRRPGLWEERLTRPESWLSDNVSNPWRILPGRSIAPVSAALLTLPLPCASGSLCPIALYLQRTPYWI